MANPPSPKRRRILSSFNPDDTTRIRSPTPDYMHLAPDNARPSWEKAASGPKHPTKADTDGVPESQEPAPRVSKFRLKTRSKHSSSSSSRRRRRSSGRGGDHFEEDSTLRRSRSRSPYSHHHRHRRRHRHRSSDEKPSGPDEHANPTMESGRLSPNTAFRESLFDAMADDEGAAYWERVYGQPIHVYSRDKPSATGEGGSEVDRMTDDEYAAYVRQKMWEKTHAGLIEERKRREEEKQRKEAEREKARRVTEEMERSLRRGEERRKRRAWREGWERYVAAQAKWDGKTVEGIPWPTRTGKREGIGEEGDEVRLFFERGLERHDIGDKEFAAKLKEERVRWHPDKIQQRLGGKVEEGVMKDVTAIFQVVDRLWNDVRPAA